MDPKGTTKEKRERLRQNELKQNPGGALRDGLDNGAGNGNLTDIAGDMGWRGMLLLILILFLGYIVYQFFFS